MAEDKTHNETEDGDRPEDSTPRRRPSVLLVLAGLTALIISGWALAGPFALTVVGADAVRWIFVGVAVVVGVILVLSPNRHKEKN